MHVTFVDTHHGSGPVYNDYPDDDTDAILRAAGYATADDDWRYVLPSDMSDEHRRHVQAETITSLVTEGRTVAYKTVSGHPLPDSSAHSNNPAVDRVLSWAIGVAARLPKMWLCTAEFSLRDAQRAETARQVWSGNPDLPAELITANTVSFHNLTDNLHTLAMPLRVQEAGFTLISLAPHDVLLGAPFAARCSPAPVFAPADPAGAASTVAGLFRQSQQDAQRTYAEHAERFSRQFLGAVPLSVRLEPDKGIVIEPLAGTPAWMRAALSRLAWGQGPVGEFVFPYRNAVEFDEATTRLRRAGVPTPDFTTADAETRGKEQHTKHAGPAASGSILPPTPRASPKHGR